MKSIQIPVLDYKLAADWYEGGEDIILFLVGFPSSKKSYKELATELTQKTGMSALVLDYSGFGESPFNLEDVTPGQNFLDVITVFDWLQKEHPKATINVIGTSYGGYMGVQLTKYRAFPKLVLRAPAIYAPDEFYTPWRGRIEHEADSLKEIHAYRNDPEQLAKHPLLGRASKFEGKVLVVAHEYDEFVPRATSDAYIKAFGADSYLAEGFKHNFLSNPSEADRESYRQVIADWLQKS